MITSLQAPFTRDRRMIFLGAFAALIMSRWWIPERPLDALGIRAVYDAAFAVFLLGFLITAGYACGLLVLKSLDLESRLGRFRAVLAVPLGLGLIASTVYLLGLLGMVSRWAYILLLAAWYGMSWTELGEILDQVPGNLRTEFKKARGLGVGKQAFLVSLAVILVLTGLQALLPPTGVDGLIYHLQGPKLYLEKGKIYPVPGFTPGGFPSLVEMLFMLGMAFGSDTLAQLIHLAYGLLWITAVFLGSARILKNDRNWYVAALLLGMPILPIWAGLPYIDLAWALYEFLALYALMRAVKGQKAGWLAVSGILAGFGMGSKYLALGGSAVLGVCGLWWMRKKQPKIALRYVVIFGGTAFLAAAPWYLKNFFWYQNPTYPFFEGFWSGQSTVGVSMGGNLALKELLLMPVNLLVHYQRYAGVYGTIELINPLLLFSLGAILVKRTEWISRLSAFAVLRYLFWLGTTPTRLRYLLPLFPILSVLSVYVIFRISEQIQAKKVFRLVLTGTAGGFVAATLVYSGLFAVDKKPLSVILGTETKSSYLERELTNFSALQFIRTELTEDDKVLMLWDSRGYYCGDNCLPDFHQARWVGMVEGDPEVDQVTGQLADEGISYLMLDRETLNYKLLYDRTGKHRRAAEFFLNEYQDQCADEIYSDQWSSVYEITCEQ